MYFRHHTDKLIYPIIVLLFLLWISYRPKYHLRPEMPTAFPVVGGGKNDLQRRIAGAYWQSALTDVQWKYAYGHSLPFDPPLEFRADVKALGPVASDESLRVLYWHRLQQLWTSPEAWTKSYEWDWSWVSDPFTSASEWLHHNADLWLKTHAPR